MFFIQKYLFPLGLFLSASLMFVIQPLAAKVLLPTFGGTPAVWTICMLYFQVLLLLGYGYAWLLSRFFHRFSWRMVHSSICLVSLCSLPLTLHLEAAGIVPEWAILQALLVQLGLPMLVIAASAPLLQYAFSQTLFNKASDPYFLYVASNAGSLLALLSYPWLLERFTTILQQFTFWNIGYLCYLLLTLMILWFVPYRKDSLAPTTSPVLSWQKKFYWVFLSFVPCSLMLGVTFYITTDLAAAPLLWVLPLALYLLTFMMTFANKPIVSHAWVGRNALFFLLFPLVAFVVGANQVAVWQVVLVNLACFFVFGLLCHGELVQQRPCAQALTTFYFCLAVGGVLAGLFNSLVAPRVFQDAYEYPLVLLLATLVIPSSEPKKNWGLPILVAVVLAIQHGLSATSWFVTVKQHHILDLCVLALMVWYRKNRVVFSMSLAIFLVFQWAPSVKNKTILTQQRSFYGIKQVFLAHDTHYLMSQTTIHGFQMVHGNRTNGSLAYYAPPWSVVRYFQEKYPSMTATVVGLGTGMMACQFRQQDKLKMVEVDQQVINIARDPSLFSYLRDCPPKTELIRDDGRLAVAYFPNHSLQLLVLDAFNSDAIPIHLMTLEAFQIYQRKLTANGAILINISNRHINLLPVVSAIAKQLDWVMLFKADKMNPKKGQYAAEWLVLTANMSLVRHLIGQAQWRFSTDFSDVLWTDNYSNLIPLLKW